jgi:hypothetical protein
MFRARNHLSGTGSRRPDVDRRRLLERRRPADRIQAEAVEEFALGETAHPREEAGHQVMRRRGQAIGNAAIEGGEQAFA